MKSHILQKGGVELSVNSAGEWAHDFNVTADRISFTTDPNESEPGSDPRQTTLTLSYPGAKSVEAIVRQAAPERGEPEKLSFTIEISKTTPSSVVAGCTPSDADATYVLRLISKTDYEEYPDDEALIASDIEFFRRNSWTGEPGQIADHLKTGPCKDEEFGILVTAPHYIYAYGLEADGTVTSELFKTEFSVPERPVIEIVQPELLPVEGGNFKASYSITHPIEGAEIEITQSLDDWVHDITVSGNEISFTVDPNTDAEPESDPRESHFNVSYPDAYNQFVRIRQASPEQAGLGFELKILSLTSSEVRVECTPNDPEATYVLRSISKSDYDELGSDDQLIASDIESFLKPDWLGNPGEIANHLIKGIQEDTFSLFDTKPHYIYAYGLTADGTATSAVIKTEVTAPARPVVNASDPGMLPVEGGRFEVTYTVDNPAGDALPTLELAWGLEWAHDFAVTEGKITFVVDSNAAAEPGSEPRSSFFRIQYPDAYDKVVTLKQFAPELPE